MFWTVSGWIIALLALLVNILQLIKNNELKNKIALFEVKNNVTTAQQTHSGHGHNINAANNVKIGD